MANAQGRREQRRVQHHDLSRGQLLDAAEEVFGRKGFHETTLKEVAELAEFSVGSVYSFFENKDDLFRQIFVRRGEEFMAELRARPRAAVRARRSSSCTGSSTSRSGSSAATRTSAGCSCAIRAPRCSRTDRQVDAAITENYDEAMRLQAQLFERGQAAGEIRAGDPEVLGRLFSGLVAAFQAMDPAVMSDDPVVDGAVSAEAFSLDDLHDVVEAAFRTT